MSWRGHTTTNSEDQLVRQLDALGAASGEGETGFFRIMSGAVDLIEKLDNTLDTLQQENEALKQRTKGLCEVARRNLCYLPRAYDSKGPHGEMLEAIAEIEEDEKWNQ